MFSAEGRPCWSGLKSEALVSADWRAVAGRLTANFLLNTLCCLHAVTLDPMTPRFPSGTRTRASNLALRCGAEGLQALLSLPPTIGWQSCTSRYCPRHVSIAGTTATV